VLGGGAALWGAVLGVPLTGAVLAFELTQDLRIFVPCWIAAWLGRELVRALRMPSLLYCELQSRGISWIEGRSLGVLESLLVRDAMVVDFEIARDTDAVATIRPRVLRSRYPFLPVVDEAGQYLGLLTVDMVREASELQDEGYANSPLSQLLEVKDLLYRVGFKTPVLKPEDRLTQTIGLFMDLPCVPVVGADGKVAGLLFADSARLSYDREVARRFVGMESRGG
jgi:hypothetical protein